ncbi:hypothetical protein B0I37DRAFT_130273 [Chaetomium sp. MPI-CAGE-AT-0009]|nr:hypothetical protein B0I37DRAFT_130273 [Chaetomium sp. MPI-CAGE-AT-0009]
MNITPALICLFLYFEFLYIEISTAQRGIPRHTAASSSCFGCGQLALPERVALGILLISLLDDTTGWALALIRESTKGSLLVLQVLARE